jgi:hypothetical protein
MMDEDMMDSSYGKEAPVTAPGEGDEPAVDAKPSVDEQNQMDDSALVPTKVLSPDGEPIKEGDEIVVQVVSVHGDQAIVKYAPKKGGDEAPSGEGETTSNYGNEDAEIAALDKG